MLIRLRHRLTACVGATVAWLGAPAAVHAAAPCEEVIFDCSRDPAVFVGKNLRQLRSERRSDAWIRKLCTPTFAMPTGCDWRRTSAPAPGPAQTLVLTDATPLPGAAGGPAGAPTAPRDPGGRIGPTPAPALDGVAAAGNPLDPKAPFAAEVAAAAQRYKLPVELVRAVMQVESGNSPIALSHRGAVGLMQLLPETGQAMGVTDLYDPAQNVAGGARFLRVLANRFQGDLVKVLSAYHAGSARVQTREATPFAATDDYVRKVLRLYYQLRDAAERSRAAPPGR